MAVNNTKMRMIKKSSCLSNKMGARTMEVSAVGAWVQPANNSSDYEDAVVSVLQFMICVYDLLLSPNTTYFSLLKHAIYPWIFYVTILPSPRRVWP